MKDELFNELVASVREGGAILRGEAAPARAFSLDKIDIKEIREGYTLFQSQFAASPKLRDGFSSSKCPIDFKPRKSDNMIIIRTFPCVSWTGRVKWCGPATRMATCGRMPEKLPLGYTRANTVRKLRVLRCFAAQRVLCVRPQFIRGPMVRKTYHEK